MTATYTGVTCACPSFAHQWTDGLGLFGPVGGSLEDTAFTISFTYDTAIGADTHLSGGELLRGGTNFSLPQDATAIVTMNGISQTILGTAASLQVAVPAADQWSNGVEQVTASLDYSANIEVPGIGLPANLTTPFTVTLNAPSAGGLGFLDLVSSDETGMNLDIQTLTVTEGGAAPEPASWALMLVGFASLGAALRRRRKAALA
ncbi:PEPxxWA-CTERM sorting domain-containing protein [Phenylobacterium sp.]|uniref:PEPxxWA-CTERM sorting domain-containing protein n=1 Tax=Phenylobacterium sp. TaxID=1871053 RepID=UPI0025CC447D|nr:PEPxxWA-CTERM sorting domain-containing protein [Phenylobacterium sp.]